MDTRIFNLPPVGMPSPRIPEADDPMVSDFILVTGKELFMRPVEVSASIRIQMDLGTLILTEPTELSM